MTTHANIKAENDEPKRRFTCASSYSAGLAGMSRRSKEYFVFTFSFLSLTLCGFSDQTLRTNVEPFIATANLYMRIAQGNASPIDYHTHSRFFYKDGWWEIEQEFRHPEELSGNVVSVKKIPGGTRTYPFTRHETRKVFENDALSAAHAHPAPFPDPGNRTLFVFWLGFCPYPELPILDSKRIRSFSSFDLFNHDQNIGTYTIQYLEPGRAFVSRLEVFNNGIIFTRDGNPVRYPPPFTKGFLHYGYEVTKSATNSNGMAFPTEAVFTMYAPAPDGKTGNDLRTLLELRIEVDDVQWGEETFGQPTAAPEKLFAVDFRPRDLPHNVSVDHIVINDAWPPPNDKSLLIGAKVARNRAPKESRPRGVQSVALALLLLAFCLPALIGCRHYFRSKST
jgi:hypothetical protein